MARGVKPKQSAPTRKEKAEATRARMLGAAYRLFAEQGYRSTTMELIAAAADVAVQTVYFTFHTKDELLQQVLDRAVMGDGPSLPPPDQPWYRAMAAEADARKAVALLAAGATGIFERVAPLIPVFHAVSADPAGEVYRHSEQLRYDGYADVVRILAAKAPLRSDAASATDVVFALLSPDLYRTLTAERGWDARRWLDWVAPTLYEQLFGSGRPKKR